MVRTAVQTSKIEGGFVLVSVATLMAAWQACRSAPLHVGDFRTWLACHELAARRCVLDEGRSPTYDFRELSRLLGVAEKRAKSSVVRLVAASLLEWSDSAIVFPDPAVEVVGLDDSIGRGKGSVAIPRRIVRLLAGGARPALIATVIGILLRCLSRRRGGFDGRGRVKASWVARVFGVEERRVKQARSELVALGWIEPEPADQWVENRWGRAYRINLEWDRADGPAGRRLAPPAAVEGPRLAPPVSDPDPLQERIRNQEPARPTGEPGVELKSLGNGDRTPLPAPNLDDVRPEDLHDVGRLLDLHRQAVDRKLASDSEDGRLKFFAIAEHARVVGTVNPCGLFARLVRRGLWHFATQDDEDTAGRRLREHLHGRDPARPCRVGSFIPDVPKAGPSMLSDVMARFGIGSR